MANSQTETQYEPSRQACPTEPENGLTVEMPELHEFPRFDNEAGHYPFGPDE